MRIKWWAMASLLALCGGLGEHCQKNNYEEGERLYKVHCANCHMDNGAGLGALIPPLAQSDFLDAHREQLPCILRYGLADTIVVNGVTYAEKMPGVQALSEIHITNILNFVQHRWGAPKGTFRLDEVRAALEACPKK